MQPPPGVELTAIDNADPTDLLSTTIAAATTALADMATSTSTSLSSPTSTGSPTDSEKGECQLLGPFAILVQGSLGLLALLALVYKRWRERPQRPIKIWFFDVSKQVVGSVLVHIANLLMSMLSSGQFSMKLDPSTVAKKAEEVQRRMTDGEGRYVPNPCSFYLLNLAIDTTIGIPILIFLLGLLTLLFSFTPLGVPRESIQSGHYGTPPRASWWLKQSFLYFLGLLGMKFCVLIIFLVLPVISRVGDWALKWTEGNETIQVIFVMLVFPVIMNATQYYIIDSFIKNQKAGEGSELGPGSDTSSLPDEHQRTRHRGGEGSGSDGSEEDTYDLDVDAPLMRESQDPEVLAKKKDDTRKGAKGLKSPTSFDGGKERDSLRSMEYGKDYDPKVDGESSPVTMASTGSERERPKKRDDDGGRGEQRR